MIDAVASRRFPPLPELNNRRSMVSVSDLAAAAWLAMTLDAANRRIYIVADGMDYATRSLYVAICKALDRPVPSWTLPVWLLKSGALAGAFLTGASGRSVQFGAALERLCGSACYRADRLRNELGWVPTETFFDLVDEMVKPTPEGQGFARKSTPG
jgi:nucleoside-diphosphate-sugar epimerase